MFIFWLRHIVKTAAFRSYSLLSVLLRLIRHCQSILNGKEEDFREWPGGLALSSQPGTNLNQPDSEPAPPVSLAVPLLEAPLQSLHNQGSQPQMDTQHLQIIPGLHGGSNDAALNTDFPSNSSAPLVSDSVLELSIPKNNIQVTMPSPLAAQGQTFDITLIPIIPRQINRYWRNVRAKNEFKAFLVQKGPLDCSEELDPIAGWEPLTQPEGALIFYHPYKRVFTDANARDPETAVKLATAVEKAYKEACNADIFLQPSVELALEFMMQDGKEIMGYYFVDHKRRVIFWFEDHTSYPLMEGVRGVERKSHIKYALETQYWTHIELFPNKRSLPEDVAMELKELVMYTQADGITSATPLTLFTSDKIASMLSLVDLLKDSTNKECEHSVWIAARFMKNLCSTKFMNFCGQPSARLDVDQSLYGESDASKNMLFRAMNVILFGSPDAQSRAFHRILVDQKIVDVRWKQYIDKLNSDWNGYTIFSTVMLAVDISFLAVPSIETQTPATLLSYMSTLCVMGSLIVTLLLVGHVNKSLRGSITDGVSFLTGMAGSVLGLESFPFMLSLPFGLLIWGIVFFAAALSVVIFRTSGIAIISIAYPTWVVIVILAMWCVLAANRIHAGSLLRRWLRIRYRNTSQFIVYLWNRIIEQMPPTASTPSHV
ncbi:uncharacterized protein F5147DRAFT_619830 [Suillus discolor]|uniref:Uncharacterized protein n=1 Tax=Suillus discolor TaxID=1912936 RepID=A0A9P7EV04_9AGAM|nr:uncharacterized protein F5147DRAFT_619830 [Suillus discolor]KAG2091844.1 hypothetical protein F5147DRAFT_619830 [Suillus discolor]